MIKDDFLNSCDYILIFIWLNFVEFEMHAF